MFQSITQSKPVALILGATGRTGSHLVNLLEKDSGPDNLEIRVAVRKPEQAEAFTKRGIATVHLDLDDLSTYESALQGVQRLFMITGYTVDMLSQGKNLTDAAKNAGVEYIVHIGTFHQPGRPQTKLIRHYIWHQLIETYIEASGIAWTHLHPNAFMQNFFGAVQDGKLRMFFGHERVGLVDCYDLARVAAAALRHPQPQPRDPRRQCQGPAHARLGAARRGGFDCRMRREPDRQGAGLASSRHSRESGDPSPPRAARTAAVVLASSARDGSPLSRG